MWILGLKGLYHSKQLLQFFKSPLKNVYSAHGFKFVYCFVKRLTP